MSHITRHYDRHVPPCTPRVSVDVIDKEKLRAECTTHAFDFRTVKPLPCPFCGVVPDVTDCGWMHPENDCILRMTIVTGVGDWNRRDPVGDVVIKQGTDEWYAYVFRDRSTGKLYDLGGDT